MPHESSTGVTPLSPMEHYGPRQSSLYHPSEPYQASSREEEKFPDPYLFYIVLLQWVRGFQRFLSSPGMEKEKGEGESGEKSVETSIDTIA